MKKLKHVLVLVRHGDRCPSYNLFEPMGIESFNEASVWIQRLPPNALRSSIQNHYPVDYSHHSIPSQISPITTAIANAPGAPTTTSMSVQGHHSSGASFKMHDNHHHLTNTTSSSLNLNSLIQSADRVEVRGHIHSSNSSNSNNNNHHHHKTRSNMNKTRDEHLGWASSLTLTGVNQMKHIGNFIKDRYHEFLDDGKSVQIYSSNFTRTQFSGQCLLDGLHGVVEGSSIESYPIGLKRSSRSVVVPQNHSFLNIWGHLPKDLLNHPLQREYDNKLRGKLEANQMVKRARMAISKALPSFSFMLRPFHWSTALDYFQCRYKFRQERVNKKVNSDDANHGGKNNVVNPYHRQRAIEIFEIFDRDKNGYIEWEDIKHSFPAIFGLTRPSEKEIISFLKASNTGKDVNNTITKQNNHQHHGISHKRLRLSVNDFVDLLSHMKPNLCAGLNQKETNQFEEEWDQYAATTEMAMCERFRHILHRPEILNATSRGFLDYIHHISKHIGQNENNNSPKVEVMVTHDVAIVPLLTVLKFWMDSNVATDSIQHNKWPRFGAAIVIEFHGESHKNMNLKVYQSNGFNSISSDEWKLECVIDWLSMSEFERIRRLVENNKVIFSDSGAS